MGYRGVWALGVFLKLKPQVGNLTKKCMGLGMGEYGLSGVRLLLCSQGSQITLGKRQPPQVHVGVPLYNQIALRRSLGIFVRPQVWFHWQQRQPTED